jgi:hypothetical protein
MEVANPGVEDFPVNRMELRQLAEDRMFDAAALLAAQRWADAY